MSKKTAKEKFLKILNKGVGAWNSWREKHPEVEPDLSGLDLIHVKFKEALVIDEYGEAGALFVKDPLLKPKGNEFAHKNAKTMVGSRKFIGVNFSRTNLSGCNLESAILCDSNLYMANLENTKMSKSSLSGSVIENTNFRNADLRGADLSNSVFINADFTRANLSKCTLTGTALRGGIFDKAIMTGINFDGVQFDDFIGNAADLSGCMLERKVIVRARMAGAILKKSRLTDTKFQDVDLSFANLRESILINCSLEGGTISGSNVFGVSVWNLILNGTTQNDLYISQENEASIAIDNIEVAQFIYLLINNEKIRGVLDTITTKLVLILGRFTKRRMQVLDRLKDTIRAEGFLPVIFDFEKPTRRNLTETISILAHMARFVVADITDARSIAHELEAIIPNLPSVPVIPVLEKGSEQYAMFEHFERYPWVLPLKEYKNQIDVVSIIKELTVQVLH